jgi:hypothetical protein
VAVHDAADVLGASIRGAAEMVHKLFVATANLFDKSKPYIACFDNPLLGTISQ